MKKILLLALLAVVSNAFSQNWPVKQLVTDKKLSGKTFVPVPAFRFTGNKQLAQRGSYQELQLDAAFTRQIMAQRPEALTLKVPLSATETITCELVKASLGNIKFTENNNQVIPKVQIPVLYRGIVTGEQQKNTAILTVNTSYVSLIITSGNRAIQITQADNAAPLTYRLYDSRQVQFPHQPMNCSTDDLPTLQTPDGILLNGTVNRTNAVQDKCVNAFVDCCFPLYQFLDSSRQRTIYYVYELFNLVTTGYLNDSINIQVCGINVWTAMDPFRRDSSRAAIKDIGALYKDNFWGNIGVSLDYSTGLGGLGWIGKVKAVTTNSCPSFNTADSTGPFAYNDLNFNGNFDATFPTGPNVTGPQLALVMHEIGHKLGSVHTHRCGWQLTPTMTGAIDSCVAIENPPCANVGTTPPPGGGTIMSYCHLRAGSFISYSNGFGLLPGNAIRNFVNNTACIPSCQACLIGKSSGDGVNKHVDLLPSPANISQLKRTLLPSYAYRQNAYPAKADAVIATVKDIVGSMRNSMQKPEEKHIRLFTPASVR